MSFKPAGYCDNTDDSDDGFYFGDNYEHGGGDSNGQYDDRDDANENPIKESLVKDEDAEKRYCSPPSSVVSRNRPGDEAILTSNDHSHQSQQLGTALHFINHNNSPVTFKIADDSQDFDDYDDFLANDPVVINKGTDSFSRKSDSGSRRSGGGDRVKMKSQMKNLEVEEDMKIAVMRGNIEEVARLLDQGLNPDLPLKSSWPPLLHACENCQEAIIKLLLDKGANPNSSKDQLTALMVTCMTKPHHLRDKVEKCARLLIDHGAQVNASDRYHMTPLLYASQTGSTALAQLLISANADVNAKEVRGWTPIFFAASNGHTPLVRLLVKSGGDPKAKCNFGETPYSMACSAGHTATADLLESLSDDKLSTSPPIKGSTEKTCELLDQGSSNQLLPLVTGSSTIGDLEMFLMGLQLGELIPVFHEHKVEFGQLISMTDADLRLMGVAKVGHRKKILKGILEVHKKEWRMPKNVLPYGQPISSAELSIILSNLACHTKYLQGSAQFLLTHVQSDSDLFGPHLEPCESQRLCKGLSEAVEATHTLQSKVKELNVIAAKSLSVEVLESESSNKEVKESSSAVLNTILGMGAIVCFSVAISHFFKR